ncbi:hypothetical protein ABW16_01900 [Mycolicibacter heraklionensis]|uniref:Uncharacterized protein n=1 Tax=Mycolicibacter heraklionensis TaxID=512402 RepID=A0ABR5FKP2_9MYCO|nr:hypothetical protein [Mycolicibacter heraklionensis]KLO31605.1 hypothetical protein ABW16_01900 [Mycolicibacter heraklionensis]
MSKSPAGHIAPDDFANRCTVTQLAFRQHFTTHEVQEAASRALAALDDVTRAVDRAALRSRIDMNERQIKIDRRKLAELTEGTET